MNIQQVKSNWTMQSLLSALGYSPDPQKSKGHDLWYASPFRPSEKEASFHIHTGRNIWNDFGHSGSRTGGDLIAFAQSYLESMGKPSGVSEALRWFKTLSGHNTRPLPLKRSQRSENDKKAGFKLLSAKPIFTPALFDYLDQRGIDRQIGLRFLKQVYFLHPETGKKYYAVGIQNQSGGYEVRNGLGFKGCVGAKDITFIKAETDSEAVEVFEGMFDFLSRITLLKTQGKPHPENDCIILNTNTLYAACASQIALKKYRKCLFWLDNDPGGTQGRAAIEEAVGEKTDRRVAFQNQSDQYKGYKDLNAWHAPQP